MKTKPTKAIIASVGTFVTLLSGVFADEVFDTANELPSVISGLVVLGLTIYGVWRVPNKEA